MHAPDRAALSQAQSASHGVRHLFDNHSTPGSQFPSHSPRVRPEQLGRFCASPTSVLSVL